MTTELRPNFKAFFIKGNDRGTTNVLTNSILPIIIKFLHCQQLKDFFIDFEVRLKLSSFMLITSNKDTQYFNWLIQIIYIENFMILIKAS